MRVSILTFMLIFGLSTGIAFSQSGSRKITSSDGFLNRLEKFTNEVLQKQETTEGLLKYQDELLLLCDAKEKYKPRLNKQQQKRYELLIEKGASLLSKFDSRLNELFLLYDVPVVESVAYLITFGGDTIGVGEFRSPAMEVPQGDTPFTSVDEMPVFPGGETEMHRFISANLVYPAIAMENGIQGRVILRFVVEKDGSVSDIRVLRGIDPVCDKEAVRVICAMPDWIPGKQNGRLVRVYYTLPIQFKLSVENKKVKEKDITAIRGKYGPADSAEEFLNNAERFLNEVLLTATSIEHLKSYEKEMDIIDADYKKYKETYTKEQEERSERLRNQTKANIAKWTKEEEPVEDEDEEDVVQGKYGPSGSVNELIKNMERFLSEVVLRLTSIEQVYEYEAEMKNLDRDYRRYERTFTIDQKVYLDEIRGRVRDRLSELGEKLEK